MKKASLLLLTLILSFTAASCSSTGDAADLYIDKGKYSMTVFDGSGDKIAEGMFDIKNIEGDKMSGTYVITELTIPNPLLAVNETKEMTGTISPDRKQVFINANPRISDSNIFLTITAGMYSYFGKWRYSTYVGTVDQGTVRATKME